MDKRSILASAIIGVCIIVAGFVVRDGIVKLNCVEVVLHPSILEPIKVEVAGERGRPLQVEVTNR
jgi:hypothetical protein